MAKSTTTTTKPAKQGRVRRAVAGGLLALGIGAAGVTLAACSSNSGDSNQSSDQQAASSQQTAGSGQQGQGGPFANIDTAKVAKALDISESKLTSAITKMTANQPTGQAGGQGGPGGSGSQPTGQAVQGGSGSQPTGQAVQGGQSGTDSNSGSSKDPMVQQLAKQLDLSYSKVLSALTDNGYTSGGPQGGAGGQGSADGQGSAGGQSGTDSDSSSSGSSGTTGSGSQS